MYGPCIAHSFGKGYFMNLKYIARRGILLESVQASSGRDEMYLPFCRYFLSMFTQVV